MGKVIVLLGIQWGDEGKGKFVDEFGEEVDFFIRVQGGANAGHSLNIGGESIVMHLIPSGATYPQAHCLLGNDMVIDPIALMKEINEIRGKNFLRCKSLKISHLAHLVMPYCFELEKLREEARGKDAIGTTLRGIGTTYEMRARRLGIRVGDLFHLEKMKDFVEIVLKELNPEIDYWGGHVFGRDEIMDFLEWSRNNLSDYIANQSISQIITEAKLAGKNVLIEGAQGTELDLVHGTYPYVTSSSTIAGAACSGAGIGPTLIDEVIGVTKAYNTRVGNGPFPTKIIGDLAEKIRQTGGEFGASTGRPRDVGWVDGPQLRHAARINGLTGLVITKGDVLSGIKPNVCHQYKLGGSELDSLDDVNPQYLQDVDLVYEELEAFGDISTCRDYTQLPDSAKILFESIAGFANAPIVAVSVGPERGQTMILKNPWE